DQLVHAGLRAAPRRPGRWRGRRRHHGARGPARRHRGLAAGPGRTRRADRPAHLHRPVFRLPLTPFPASSPIDEPAEPALKSFLPVFAAPLLLLASCTHGPVAEEPAAPALAPAPASTVAARPAPAQPLASAPVSGIEQANFDPAVRRQD